MRTCFVVIKDYQSPHSNSSRCLWMTYVLRLLSNQAFKLVMSLQDNDGRKSGYSDMLCMIRRRLNSRVKQGESEYLPGDRFINSECKIRFVCLQNNLITRGDMKKLGASIAFVSSWQYMPSRTERTSSPPIGLLTVAGAL